MTDTFRPRHDPGPDCRRSAGRARGLAMLVALIDGVDVVAAAGDGAEAMRLAETHHPDVILMDLRMPGTDGITATASCASGCQLPGYWC